MNLGDLRTHVLRELELSLSAPVHWSLEDIDSAINDGLAELSDATEFFERSVFFNVRPSTTYHDVRHIADGDTVLRVTSVWNPARNAWLDPTDVRILDERTARQWERVAGEPQRWFQRGLYWLGLFPFTTASDRILQLRYASIHPRLTDPTQVPQQLPEEFHHALVDYAVYDLLSDDQETAKALEHWNDYTAQEAATAARAQNRTKTDRVGRLGIA